MHPLKNVDTLFDLLAAGGGEAYFGEPVTVLEHSLQAAWFAARRGADQQVIAAALLHDVGHLLHDRGEDAADRGYVTRETIKGFGLAVKVTADGERLLRAHGRVS